jgi:hypothetical protein
VLVSNFEFRASSLLYVGPLQPGLSGGHDFVKPSHLHPLGGLVKKFRLFFGLLGNLSHRPHEPIDGLLALRLCRLHHQGALDHQGEIDGRRMKSVIDQPLGDVEGAPCIR